MWSGDQLIEETPIYADGTPADEQRIRWLYEPGALTPSARFEYGKLHYMVSDHQGTPREMLDEEGGLVWAQRLTTWGKAERSQVIASNDADYHVNCNLRFLGQYEDEESGLYYNRFRYYSPETGQYLSPDPIGLMGGLNPYGYVHNPSNWVDPYGLTGCPNVSSKGKLDHLGDGRPVSGHTGFLNSPRLSRSQLTQMRDEMAKLGIKFVKNADKHLPKGVRGGFDYGSGTLYLRKGATLYEAFHEMAHARQFAAIGQQAYKALGTYAREAHVFNQIFKNRSMFSSAEVKHAIGYMRSLKDRYLRGIIN
ncbi:RHS family protein [Xenorhabdus sp. PB62.4]|nr:RHS family protein [Xenorhabdus sp. PB62.4]